MNELTSQSRALYLFGPLDSGFTHPDQPTHHALPRPRLRAVYERRRQWLIRQPALGAFALLILSLAASN
jgi:hypothetical protein